MSASAYMVVPADVPALARVPAPYLCARPGLSVRPHPVPALPHMSRPTAGAAMQAHASVEVAPGAGIPGDRYATNQGHWSDPRWPDQELTLVAQETADALAVDARSLRRNVVRRGIELDALIGITFRIGSATLLGVRPCNPCRYLDSLTRPGLARDLAGRGGLRVRILQGGRLAVGDEVVVEAG